MSSKPCQLSKLPPAFTFNIVPYYMDDFTHRLNALIHSYSSQGYACIHHSFGLYAYVLRMPTTTTLTPLFFGYLLVYSKEIVIFVIPSSSQYPVLLPKYVLTICRFFTHHIFFICRRSIIIRSYVILFR